MRYADTLIWLATAASTIDLAVGQTFTKCNPLQGTCPADPALGSSQLFDFTKGSSSAFSAAGAPSYDSNGASFSVAKSGDAPTITSNWYIMFGHVEVVMKAAPGVGIVSSMVLQSDDLDEVDFEWLGADNTQVQSNYFGKGNTGSYNRGAFHANPGNQNGFHTYTVDWTANQIVWQIDGVTVRALTQANAEPNQYPQTPMQLKLGIWSGGDPSNAPGTITWAGGSTNYGAGPYTMQVKSVKAIDYSTGKEYTYGDTSGSWQSIKSNGGTINSSGSGAGSVAVSAAPPVTSVSNGAPLPFSVTPQSVSTFVKPSIYPWIPEPTNSPTTMVTSIAGLPSGWTVTPSGKVVPPSAAPSPSPPVQSTQSQAVSPLASLSAAAGGYETITTYNQQGFPTVVVQPAGFASASKSYDVHGSLITSPPTPVAGGAKGAADVASTSAHIAFATGGAGSKQQNIGLGMVACGLLALMI
ncbi:hypothetical protein MMC30_005985 [Trapelia coarctata]|nr:hypothetical protein [Trapelia coarctata]